MWQCKVCGIEVSSRYELLKHSKLKHGHFGARFRHPCEYSNCPCTFKSWNNLLRHIYRAHHDQSSPKQEQSATFSCQLCACMDVIKEKMQLTFSYRRQELVEDLAMVSDLQTRWPALFTVNEINAEFMRITTVPLLSKFMAQLDRYTVNLHKIFSSKGGASGQKLSRIMAISDKCDDMHIKRDCLIQSLCVYLNEDITTVVKEFEECNSEEAERGISETTLGLFVVRKEGAGAEDQPEDVGVVIDGVKLLQNLKSVSFGFAMLFGLIYALNLSYPQNLKFTFEFLQKVVMNLDGSKLSSKIQALKIKMFQ